MPLDPRRNRETRVIHTGGPDDPEALSPSAKEKGHQKTQKDTTLEKNDSNLPQHSSSTQGIGEAVPLPSRGKRTIVLTGDSNKVQPSEFMKDPPVGCLLVISGHGQGAILKLGPGMNAVGRGNQRVRLDFGDQSISDRHAEFTYDPKSRRYFITHGGGINLTYLGEEPVLGSPVELKGGEVVLIGETTLKFFPFCSEEWSWDSQKSTE